MNEQRRPARNAAAVMIAADFSTGRGARGETPPEVSGDATAPDDWLEWKPRQIGDTLVGVVGHTGTWHDPYGNAWPALSVNTGRRDVVVVVRPRVLRAKLNYWRPRPGDAIAIRYEGMPGGKVKAYTVRVLERTFDWNDIARPTDDVT